MTTHWNKWRFQNILDLHFITNPTFLDTISDQSGLPDQDTAVAEVNIKLAKINHPVISHYKQAD